MNSTIDHEFRHNIVKVSPRASADYFDNVMTKFIVMTKFNVMTKFIAYWRQCGPVVRALALRSGDPGFKTGSDRSLNLILVVPGSTSQLHL